MHLRHSRNSKGAALGLVAACASVLASIVAGFFVIAMLLGGAREIQNATDAGALNLAKEIFTDARFKVKRNASSFADLQDKNGEFGLANINAVWGKALLIQANADAMREEGLAGDSVENADRLFAEAESISNELAAKLKSKENQVPLFEEMAQQNSLRMLGPAARVTASNNGGAEDALSW